MIEYERNLRTRIELKEHFDELSEKILRSRKQLARETDEATKYRLEQQIKEDEQARSAIESQIKAVETEIFRTVSLFLAHPATEKPVILDAVESLGRELNMCTIKNVSRQRLYKPLEDGIPTEIREAIDVSTHVIVMILSDEGEDAEALERWEAQYAKSKDKNVILLLFPGSVIPSYLTDCQAINVSDWVTVVGELLNRFMSFVRLEQPHANHRELEKQYLKGIIDELSHWQHLYTSMSITGKLRVPKVPLKPAAERLFNLQHRLHTVISHAYEDDPANIVQVTSFTDLLELVRKYKRIALIGDPGSGKTTTLERIALDLAQKASDDEASPIPVIVRLGGYVGSDFTQYINESLPQLHIADYLSNRIFLLLDGLNEMPVEYVAGVDEWLRAHPDTPVLVSCRKLDYIERKLDLQRVDVAPLDVERIYEFISAYLYDSDREALFWELAGRDVQEAWAWYKANISGENGFYDFWYGDIGRAFRYEEHKFRLKEVQDTLRERGLLPNILGLMTNPFVIATTIKIYARSGKTPSNRGDLFRQFVQILTEELGKRAVRPGTDWIDEKAQILNLSQLAHNMMSENMGTHVPEEWVLSLFEKTMSRQTAQAQVYFASSAGILSRSVTGFEVRISFSHQLLQEYFAALEMAKDIARKVPAIRYWSNTNWWEPTRWDETALLLAGMETSSTDVVQWLTPVNPSLAYRCAIESGAPCSEQALKLLLNPEDGMRVCPVAHAEWGRRLNDGGDTRPGVGLRQDNKLPDIVWCRIPHGTFRMGGDQDLMRIGLYWEGEEININYDFYMAKYPVTYAQFQQFVIEGYKTEKYWTEAGWRWRCDQEAPKLWNDPTFHLDNHPVVGVTWYESFAFSRWLNERYHEMEAELRKSIDLPPLWEVRLPLEAEWEKTARYPDGRKYPWGDRYIPGHANIDETSEDDPCGPYFLRRTTAVGIYQHNVNLEIGVHDLVGNIWEWCVSKWNVNYEFPESIEPDGTEHRGIRGGSWYNSSLFSPAAHDCLDPDFGVYDIGFRVVLAPLKPTDKDVQG